MGCGFRLLLEGRIHPHTHAHAHTPHDCLPHTCGCSARPQAASWLSPWQDPGPAATSGQDTAPVSQRMPGWTASAHRSPRSPASDSSVRSWHMWPQTLSAGRERIWAADRRWASQHSSTTCPRATSKSGGYERTSTPGPGICTELCSPLALVRGRTDLQRILAAQGRVRESDRLLGPWDKQRSCEQRPWPWGWRTCTPPQRPGFVWDRTSVSTS